MTKQDHTAEMHKIERALFNPRTSEAEAEHLTRLWYIHHRAGGRT